MGLKDRLIAKEEGSQPQVTTDLTDNSQNTELDLNINLDDVFASAPEREQEPNIDLGSSSFSEAVLLNSDEALDTTEVTTEPSLEFNNLKIDRESEGEAEEIEQVEEDVCPKCGGKRRRNGNYYHLKTCEDYKINGIYPNRAEEKPEENVQDIEPASQQRTEDTQNMTDLHNQLMRLAKQVILSDIKDNYTSKLLTQDALNSLIDAYLTQDTNTSITNANQVFCALLDEIIASNYKQDHYKDLTISVLEAIKVDL